jgi:hypothetical protein
MCRFRMVSFIIYIELIMLNILHATNISYILIHNLSHSVYVCEKSAGEFEH